MSKLEEYHKQLVNTESKIDIESELDKFLEQKINDNTQVNDKEINDLMNQFMSVNKDLINDIQCFSSQQLNSFVKKEMEKVDSK